MPITVTCSQCSASLRAPDTAAGKTIKCPKCAALITIPAPPAEEMSVQPVPPPMPPPMATAAPKNAIEDDDRPRRPRRDDDDYEDRPSRRWSRRSEESGNSSGSNGLCIGLGIGSICLGVIASIFGIIPCCGALVAWPAGGIGLLIGLIGVLVALLAKQKSTGALILTIAGSVINLGGIGLATVMWIWVIGKANETREQAERIHKDAIQNMERMRKQQEEERDRQKKQKEDEANRVINEPMFQDQKRKSQENLKKIAKALLDYEKKYGHLPYARYGGPDNEAAFGKGLSWRVAILPFLGRQDLYDRFQFDKPWHNPANRKVAEEMPEVFMSPRHPGEKKRTYYQVFTGDGLFGKQNVPPQTKVLSRPANAVFMVAEGSDLIDWHEPRDIDFHAVFLPHNIGGVLTDKHFNVALANGEVVFISRAAYTDEQIRDLIPYNGGKVPPIWPPLQK